MLYDDDGMFVKTFSLGDQNDFSLHQILYRKHKYVEIKTMLILYQDKLLTRNYTNTLEFFVTLDAFIKKNLSVGDENRFFIYRQQKKESYTIRSLQFKHGEKVYISTLQAMRMYQIFYESKTGLSTKSALETGTEIKLLDNKFPDYDKFATYDFQITEQEEYSFSFTVKRVAKMNDYINNTVALILKLKALKEKTSDS